MSERCNAIILSYTSSMKFTGSVLTGLQSPLSVVTEGWERRRAGLNRKRRNLNAWQILFSNYENVLSIFQEIAFLWMRVCFQSILCATLLKII